ncbi:Rpn family recombination-promoting nuclease/putative transposase [Runella aurantiaca]|uniref:Rpn family recombination-promoting nuclease/putative transposase n=1 Tax=Runella aurantiaca TaxID=2282308 RepID=A0A369I348_9BACT|nr:Rpn family recombination-promoting nuclease/putative transposase [Runella aurantiaca]RDB03472.1 Rpn family recombination-promoting nuclease/putative transposase [Runella aurantiaca]
MAFAEKYINPFTDFGFKKLFGSEPNKELLIDFLNQVVLPEQHRITELSYTRNEHLGAKELDRKAIFDLYCIGKNGERFIVEMQKAKQNYFKDRSVFYASFPIQEQAKRGEWDFQLTEIYTVGVLDFVFSEDAHEKEVRHEVKLKDQNGRVFYKKLTFVYLEMPHFTKTEEELETTYDKWLYVLKHLPYLDSKPKALQEKVFDQLFAVAEIAKFTPDEMNAYEQSLKYYRDLKNVIDTAIMEGETKGRMEGRLEGEMKGRIEGRLEAITESIIKALSRGKLTVEEIAEDFGVSVDFVLQIKEEQRP